MKKELIDFNNYSKPEEVKDYELFIGPNGEYYKVKTKYESGDNCTHYEWAQKYLEDRVPSTLSDPVIRKKCNTPLQILIHMYGYIRYTHSYGYSKPIFDLPNSNYFGYKLSKEQIDSIYKLLDFNKETIDQELIEKIHDSEEREFSEKVDIAFNRHVHR